jgi:hypothetical protein
MNPSSSNRALLDLNRAKLDPSPEGFKGGHPHLPYEDGENAGNLGVCGSEAAANTQISEFSPRG